MYKVSAPISTFYHGRKLDRERALAELKRTGSDRVFLVAPDVVNSDHLDEEFAELSDCIRFFEGRGMETGVWIGQTIGHGGLGGDRPERFTRIVNLAGKPEGNTYCPLDENFARTVCEGVRKTALAGAKIILIDDDFRMGWRGGTLGCVCARHVEAFQKATGTRLTREQIVREAYTGAPSAVRAEWLRLTGESLNGLARRMRGAVDGVDPSVRMGLCACCSTWDLDGTDSFTLARIMAGKTRPLLRLIGAPYWAGSWRRKLANIIEMERLERSWGGEGIEIISEGDTYPRPRHAVPASWLEGFDTALRADGSLDGILKYMFDYVSGFGYETKYADAAEKNRGLYAAITEMFAGLEATGARPVRRMVNLPTAVLPGEVDPDYLTNYFFFADAIEFLTDNSIPAAYRDGTGPAVVFGQDARGLDPGLLRGGAILDAEAARILGEAGIDAGFESMRKAPGVTLEYYMQDDEYVQVGGSFYEIVPRGGAKALSKLITGGEEIGGAYAYENGEGTRLLVLPFDAYPNRHAHGVFRGYCRQRQIARALPWLSRKPFDALCLGNPDLYMIVKKGDGRLAVGLWNFSNDAVEDPAVELGGPYARAELINWDGGHALDGNRLTLKGTLHPYGFAGISLFS